MYNMFTILSISIVNRKSIVIVVVVVKKKKKLQNHLL